MTTYRVVVGGGIEDVAGNPVEQDSWGFTTGDSIAPMVVATHPADEATGVRRGVTIAIDLDSTVTGVSGRTVKLRNMKTGDGVDATLTWDATTHTIAIDPSHRLDASRWYRVRILAGIEDLAGNDLAVAGFTFRTRD
jgi:hypothetical protein